MSQNTQERAAALAQYVAAGRILEAMEEFYAADVVIDDTTAPGAPVARSKTHTAYGFATQVVVLDAQGRGNLWVLAEGLLHAVDPDGVPATADGAQVINLSLGTLRETELLADIIDAVDCEDDADDDGDEPPDDDDDAVRCAAGGGAVVVSAAGNSGDTTPHYPAAEQQPGEIAVAASTEAGGLATFSSRGEWVQLAAPGELIYGAVPGGQWAVWSGTSMAAPMVAGAAALLRSARPSLTPSQVAARLMADAAPLCGTSLEQVDPARSLGATVAPLPMCP